MRDGIGRGGAVKFLRRLPGVAVAAGVIATIVWASTPPITVHESNDAVLRLAWSARPERVEECRERSEEELAKLPQHMQQRVICEGGSAQYRLTVRRDGTVVSEQVLRGGGLRQDRRLYVFHEIPLRSGEATIDVRFDRLEPDAPGAGTKEDRDVHGGGAGPRGETVPAHLALEQRLHFDPREVVLVTYSPERRVLVAVEAPGQTGQ